MEEAVTQKDEPTRSIVMMRNLALSRIGRQGDDMFLYKNGSKAYAAPFAMRLMMVIGPQIYYQYGMLNYCNRLCMEMGVLFGFRLEDYQLLANCALLSGDKPLARKYIHVLKQTLFYRDWAEQAETLLEEKTEEKDAERSALDTKIADMESALEGAKPEDKEKMAADLAALKAQREALGEEGTLSKEDVEEVDSREDVKEAREKYARAKSIAKTARERKNAMQTMADFDTKEAAMKRLEGYTRPIKDAELDAQANKILALIVEVQRQRKERTDEADTREENEITDKDYETADATTQHLVSAIRSSIARGSNFDVEEYINDHIGVDSSSRNSIGYFLASAVNEYKDLENKKAYYDRVVKPAKSLKIDGDDLKGRMYETAIEPNAERQERRAKHSG